MPHLVARGLERGLRALDRGLRGLLRRVAPGLVRLVRLALGGLVCAAGDLLGLILGGLQVVLRAADRLLCSLARRARSARRLRTTAGEFSTRN